MRADSILSSLNTTEDDFTSIKNGQSEVDQDINAPEQCSGFQSTSYDDYVNIKSPSGSYFPLRYWTL